MSDQDDDWPRRRAILEESARKHAEERSLFLAKMRAAQDQAIADEAERQEQIVAGEAPPHEVQTFTPPTLLGLRPVAELLAEEFPPIEWLVEPYLEAGCFAALVAPPNLGKTLLSFWAATRVASVGHRVDVVQMEGGRRGFQKRISRAITACGGADACKTINVSFKPRFSLMDPAAVLAMCRESKGAKLIVIDSLACATAGLDENSSQEMGQVVKSLQLIMAETGASVLIVHHTGKSKWRPGNDAPSIGDGRGSGVLDAALDTVLALAPLTESEQTSGFVTFGLYNTKQRDAEKAAPQLVRIAMTGMAAEVTMEPIGEAREALVVNSLALDVLRVVRDCGDAGCSKAFIETNVRGGNARKIAALMELKARGEVEEIPVGRHTRWRVSDFRGPQHSGDIENTNDLFRQNGTKNSNDALHAAGNVMVGGFTTRRSGSPNLPNSRSGDPSPTSPPSVGGGELGSRRSTPHRVGDWNDPESEDGQ